MSNVYIQRLRNIQDELNTTKEVFGFVLAQWDNLETRRRSGTGGDRRDVVDALRSRTKHKIEVAEANLETTYFIRLTAEFEGILKDHLRSNHPTATFPDRRRDWTVDWFLGRVLQREKLTIDTKLRQQLNDVREYRNSLAHGNPALAAVSFSEALARYNTFLAKLPEPF